MRTEVTVLPTSTPTHHTGWPSTTPKVPVVNCRGSLGGVGVVVGGVVVGGVVVVGVVVVAGAVGVVATGGVGSGVTTDPLAPEPPVVPSPGGAMHWGATIAPWPTASSSESSTVTSGVAGETRMIDDPDDPDDPPDPDALTEPDEPPGPDELADPDALTDPDELDDEWEEVLPPAPARGVGDSIHEKPELGI
jgi:hypothetical protein